VNPRRIGGALAALIVFAIGTVAPAGPADAAPIDPKAMCTPAQWQNPLNFADCAAKTRQQLQQAVNCLNAPPATSPEDGIMGWASSQPESSKTSGVSGYYSEYGVAGYTLTTYDLSCTDTVTHPLANAENEIASFIFTFLAVIPIGIDNAVRDKAYDPASVWGWSDKYVADLDHTFFHGIFGALVALSLMIVGISLVAASRHGMLSRAFETAGWAMGTLVFCTVLLQWPTASAHVADATGTGALKVAHAMVGPREENLPADQCQALLDPAACIDHRPPAVRSSDTVTKAILYNNWLRAVLGSADSATAKTYGPALYDAQVFTWGEAETSDPVARAAMIQKKQQTWMDTAAIIKTEDPQAYAHLQGLDGMDRIGAAIVAAASAWIFTGFDLISSLIILLAFTIIRFAVASAPILGSVGVFNRTSGPFVRIMSTAIASLINVAIYGLASAMFLFFVDLIFNSSGLPGPLQIGLMALAVFVSWVMWRPLVRLRRGAFDTRHIQAGLLRTWVSSDARRHAGEAPRQHTTARPGPVHATATTGTYPTAPPAPQLALWNRPE
jgi:hypothetical protein